MGAVGTQARLTSVPKRLQMFLLRTSRLLFDEVDDFEIVVRSLEVLRLLKYFVV